ncbi:SpvB/TcaC N-terminal domain-containing protein [Pedobacter africanus]|nr:SpvB/TcaC N-terminal domain-containing protein [Pedobacter africanus]
MNMLKDVNDQFLATDGSKTPSNAIEIPSISLPKGGGALKGIDEKFAVNAVNGTASLSIPLPFSPARGVVPTLGLSYNSGSGNGIFGLGWNLGLSSIKRKTEKGLPQYLDAADSDIFLFSEAEDLVPEFKKDTDGCFILDEGQYTVVETDSADRLFTIRRYKPRIEGLFARIERWSNKVSDEKKWRVTTRDNITTLFGWTINARITHPQDESKIFEWLPEFVFDDKGNCSQYIYKKEDNSGIEVSSLHNRNRIKGNLITYTNLYPDKILYGNKTPYERFGDPLPSETDYLFQTVFDYGTLHTNDAVETINNWDFRIDAFSDYKAGFEIRTTRLCKRVLLFHVFEELALRLDKLDKKTLIRSVNFEYDTAAEQDFTFLKKVTSYGYIKKSDGSYAHKRLPSMVFDYQKHEWNKDIKTVAPDALIHAPVGLGEYQYQFTDLYNEGLAGILTEQANGWYYKHNLGNAVFEPAQMVCSRPSFAGLGTTLTLTDLDGDGGKQLTSFGTAPTGFFELGDDGDWQCFRPFKAMPNVDFGDANIRLLDLNGDGKPEVLISEDDVFTWYASEGREGFATARKTLKSFDEEAGPHMVFSDAKQSIYLADMSGDGMTDILRIRNGEVCYWPNLGYGKFGTKVTMDQTPVFDHPDAFNPQYIYLADIDGSGTSDIVYLGNNKFSCWKNLSGNRFSIAPFEIEVIPEVQNEARITVTDLLGNGVACIVWSSPLAKDAHAPLKYIDLMNSKKPHIMVSYKNNLGKEVSLEYSPSTKFYIEDKLAGSPWVTKLHFPVHCVSKTVTEDKVSGYKFVTGYKYHHGYYDHTEREFRGFGMVEQTDTEFFEHWKREGAANVTEARLHQEPVITKTWYHTGAFSKDGTILNQFEADYWYAELKKLGTVYTHREKNLPDTRLVAASGIDVSALGHLTPGEWHEAMRACKGMILRSEVFAKDAATFGNTEAALQREKIPFSVVSSNCLIELVQPKGKNQHAIFTINESETITYRYEREADDPCIAHKLNISLDKYGNVLESAAVVYPRRISNIETSLPETTRDAQQKTVITYTQNQFTNEVITPGTYRLPLHSEVNTFELRGVIKTNDYYSPEDFADILLDTRSDIVSYQEFDITAVAGKAQRRPIAHTRSLFYKSNLTDPLPLGKMTSLALPYESYQLAYTPELLKDIYKDKADNGTLETLMAEGRFTHVIDENGTMDANWWVRSGTMHFIKDSEDEQVAKNRFYTPVSHKDPYGAVTKVKYDGTYFLFVEETEDALGNKTGVVDFNFRTLSPQRMIDSNNNLSETISDELGIVKAMAVMGKGAQADELFGQEEITENEQAGINHFFTVADAPGICESVSLQNIAKQLLQRATTRFIYNIDNYAQNGQPFVVATITREIHYRSEDGQLNPESDVQLSFEYVNGLGEVIMKKVQAEPGWANYVRSGTGDTIIIDRVDTNNSAGGNARQLRWIGNGRTIKNNKGNAVKQYEPFFSVSPKFENEKELVETGITSILFYDAAGRLIKTEMPDGSYTKVVFDSWKQAVYDANDNILDSEWYLKRTDSGRTDFITDLNAQVAAVKAAKHASTPKVLHFDTLGRPVLSVEHNRDTSTGIDEYYSTKIVLDAEGHLRSVIDARELAENGFKGNAVMQYKYDMLGNLVYQHSMDAGRRWLMLDIMGSPLHTWDERDYEFQYFYDVLHRPIETKVKGGEGAVLNHTFNRIFYGEHEAEPERKNLRGKPVKHYDTGGLVTTPEYDFKGQPLHTSRKFFSKYKEVANWTDDNLVNDLENDVFTHTTYTDALGRIIRQITPDGAVILPSYNEAGLLDGEEVIHHHSAVTTTYIKDIDYNEHGQRNKIIYGNDVITRFIYDEETLRLRHLETRRKNNELLQDLYYTYDAVGNITCIEDKAQPVQFYSNQAIIAKNEYTYDALYRIIAATGKENDIVPGFGGCDNWNDKAFMHVLNPVNPMAVRNYSQHFAYDAVGNILQMKHLARAGNWTRNYEYQTSNNWLKSTRIGDNGNPVSFTSYKHHNPHGFIETLPHLEKINWNFKEEMVLTIRQHCTDDQIPVITYYQYDGSGQRLRKITENQAAAGNVPTKKEERIYIEGYESYKTYKENELIFERSTLSLLDKGHRFVMVDTVTKNMEPGAVPSDRVGTRLSCYQLHNHLGSAALELDDTARIISYEEYHPYGTTAYQARSTEIRAAAKRYRYAGMERDEETGLSYHSARYYMPWMARWLSADPIGLADGTNVFAFSRNNPIVLTDTSGHQSSSPPLTGLWDGAAYKPEAQYTKFIRGKEYTLLLPNDAPDVIAIIPGNAYWEQLAWRVGSRADTVKETTPGELSFSAPPLVDAGPIRIPPKPKPKPEPVSVDFDDDIIEVAKQRTAEDIDDDIFKVKSEIRKLQPELEKSLEEAKSESLGVVPIVGWALASIYDLYRGDKSSAAMNAAEEGVEHFAEKVFGEIPLVGQAYDTKKLHEAMMKAGENAKKMSTLREQLYRLKVERGDPDARLDSDDGRTYLGPGGVRFDKKTNKPMKRIQDG